MDILPDHKPVSWNILGISGNPERHVSRLLAGCLDVYRFPGISNPGDFTEGYA
jgi:hypothetical protein